MSLQDMISQLVDCSRFNDCGEVRFACSVKRDELERTEGKEMEFHVHEVVMRQYERPQTPFNIMLKSFDFSRWLSSCLEKPRKVDKFFSNLFNCIKRPLFVEKLAKHFVESSLCILPQNRELLTGGDSVSLDVNKVERLLIQSRLRYLGWNFRHFGDKREGEREREEGGREGGREGEREGETDRLTEPSKEDRSKKKKGFPRLRVSFNYTDDFTLKNMASVFASGMIVGAILGPFSLLKLFLYDLAINRLESFTIGESIYSSS